MYSEHIETWDPLCTTTLDMSPFWWERVIHFCLLTTHAPRDCMGEAHEPCSCEEWKKWLDLIEEMKPKAGDRTSAESDEAASFRWLASRSKPCPKCK